MSKRTTVQSTSGHAVSTRVYGRYVGLDISAPDNPGQAQATTNLTHEDAEKLGAALAPRLLAEAQDASQAYLSESVRADDLAAEVDSLAAENLSLRDTIEDLMEVGSNLAAEDLANAADAEAANAAVGVLSAAVAALVARLAVAEAERDTFALAARTLASETI